MATPLLFHKVYVSPRDKSTDIFSNITKHPVLRNTIREMVCSILKACELLHDDYFYDLSDRSRPLSFQLGKKCQLHSPHSKLNDVINDTIHCRTFQSNLFTEHIINNIVIEGFQAHEVQSLEDDKE